jgi:hypothetical protein
MNDPLIVFERSRRLSRCGSAKFLGYFSRDGGGNRRQEFSRIRGDTLPGATGGFCRIDWPARDADQAKLAYVGNANQRIAGSDVDPGQFNRFASRALLPVRQ